MEISLNFLAGNFEEISAAYVQSLLGKSILQEEIKTCDDLNDP